MPKRERRGRTTAKRAAVGGALAAGVIGLWAGPAAASWPGNTPPNPISPVPTTATPVDLSGGLNGGSASIAGDEVDWYTFVAPRSGTHSVWTSTSTNPPYTVLALYDSAGTLLASNDDYAPPDRDSEVDVALVQGARYYFGITNYTNTGPGAYDYYVRAPK